MSLNINIEAEFNITQKKSKKILKNNIYYEISQNGYFYDNNPGLINLESQKYEDTAIEPFIIAHPLDFDSIVEEIEKMEEMEDDNNYNKFNLYDLKKENFFKKREVIFWKFSKLDFSFQTTAKEKVKDKIVAFTNEYGLLSTGTPIISDKYKKNISSIQNNKKSNWDYSNLTIQDMNTYYIILKGEPLSLWLQEIIQMRSLVLLWKAIEKKNYNLLKKIFSVFDYNFSANNKEKTYHDLNTQSKVCDSNTQLIEYRLFPSKDILNNYINLISKNDELSKEEKNIFDDTLEFSKHKKNKLEEKCINGVMKNIDGYIISANKKNLTRNELISHGKLLLNNLLKIKLTSLFSINSNTSESNEFFIKFTNNGVKIVPPNLLTYLWYEFYDLTTENKEIGWCSVCGAPQDITNKRSNWKKHKKCSNREAQKKYRDWDYLKNDKKSKEEIITSWKNISWGQAIDIEEIKKWLDKKEKEKKKELVILIALKLYFDELN